MLDKSFISRKYHRRTTYFVTICSSSASEPEVYIYICLTFNNQALTWLQGCKSAELAELAEFAIAVGLGCDLCVR